MFTTESFGGFGPGGSNNLLAPQSNNDSIVYDNSKTLEDNVINLLHSSLSSETKDYLVQYWMNEQASKNAYQRELDARSSQYQDAVSDLKKAGISPFLAFDSLRGGSVSSSAGSVSGGFATERRNQINKNLTDSMGKIGTVISIIAAAVITALL